MSIKILNIHEHEIFYSVLIDLVNNPNYKYVMQGLFSLRNNYSIELKENYHIRLSCYVCGYQYRTDKKIKALTTDAPHYLLFKENCKEDPYSKDNKKIEVDKKYYKTEYFLINKDYKNIMLVGNEKEKIDYLSSEMEKYKNAYTREKENNKSINNVNEQKEQKMIKLNRTINNLKEEQNKIKKKFDELNIKYNRLEKEKNDILNGDFNHIISKNNKNYNNINKDNNNDNNKNDNINNSDNNKESEYDVVLNVDSIKNLVNKGWGIKFKKEGGKRDYEEQFKNIETLVVGVVGNGNKGKSFLLKKLSEYNVPMGYNVKTEGLSIIYRKEEISNLTILDSAGQETPLLGQSNYENNNKDGLEFEDYSRDKLVTELYIQQFILWKSNIVILLVGSITLSEQKLYARVKSELLALNENKNIKKKLFVVHNLQNIYLDKDVEDYIKNVLKQLYKVKLKEVVMFTKDGNYDVNGFDKYYLESDKIDVIHLILVNDYCKISHKYNYNAIQFLKGTIHHETGRASFPILENSKEFLLEISDQIMENKLSEKDVEINEENQTYKLKVKNHKEIQLKRFFVDEMGITKNDDNTVKYSYYVDPDKSKLIINFELPGGGKFNPPIITPIDGYYSFTFEGEINGELSPKYEDYNKIEKVELKYEEISKDKLDKIIFAKNLRKKRSIHIDLKVPYQVVQLIYEGGEPKYSKENTKKGILIYIFDVHIVKNSNPPKREVFEI